jgi:signal transduction histidine kinase
VETAPRSGDRGASERIEGETRLKPFDEMKAYVRFGPADAERLRDLWPHVEPRLRDIADVFYDRILEFENARQVFEGPHQVRRLKSTLRTWLAELLRGPWDDAYYERRRRIGEKHVAVALPDRYMFTAMTVIQQALCDIAFEAAGEGDASPVCSSIRKVTMLDLAIMTGTFMDVQERARVADMASVLLANLPSAALLVDRHGDVVGATAAARRLCQQDPIGLPLADALPAALVRAGQIPARVAEVTAGGRAIEIPRVDAELAGVQRSFRLVVQPIEHQSFAAILFLPDITHTLEVEASRRRTEALVQLGSMSAAVAHELRNPLAGISGAIQVLAGSFPEDDRRRAVMAKVRDQIGRLDRMVRDLLAFSRAPEARLARVRLEDVADVVCELARREAGAVQVVREGEGTALADADLVHRVLLNLVQNAVAALDDGPGRVRVHVEDGRVTVSDDGPGIPAAERDKVFEPFYTTKTTGTGLGLAICRNAAEAMGARLELLDEGELGGASFRLTTATA